MDNYFSGTTFPFLLGTTSWDITPSDARAAVAGATSISCSLHAYRPSVPSTAVSNNRKSGPGKTTSFQCITAPSVHGTWFRVRPVRERTAASTVPARSSTTNVVTLSPFDSTPLV